MTRTSQRITTRGRRLWTAEFDPSGHVVVSSDVDGVVRAGPVTGEEPHRLLGHAGPVNGLAVSHDGRWIASASDDALNLWPLPDVTKPPLHTLPHGELMARPESLTYLRVVQRRILLDRLEARHRAVPGLGPGAHGGERCPP